MSRTQEVGEWDEILLPVGAVDTLHVVPVDDLVAHELDRACVCGVQIEDLLNGDVLIIHWALDGRA